MIDRNYRYEHWRIDDRDLVSARHYHNYTNRHVWVQDGMGHIVECAPQLPPSGDRHWDHFVVSTIAVHDRRYQHHGLGDERAPTGTWNWAHIKGQSGFADNASVRNEVAIRSDELGRGGIYLEQEDLYVSYHTIDRDNCHHRYGDHPQAKALMRDDLGLGCYIEIVSRANKNQVFYMPFMDKVHSLTPTIRNASEQEGVVIHRKHPHERKPQMEIHPLEKFLEPGGYMGIRLYRTHVEAMHDDHEPTKQGITKEQQEYLKNRDALLKKEREAGRKDVRREMEERERKIAERERKLEEKTIAQHEKRRSDKVGLLGAIAKAFTTVIGFFTALFI